MLDLYLHGLIKKVIRTYREKNFFNFEMYSGITML